MSKSNWKKLISLELETNNETWADVIKCTLTKKKLLVAFDCGYGDANGQPFTLWTINFVYFPAQYDGSEWCASVPRNPCKKATAHIGGG